MNGEVFEAALSYIKNTVPGPIEKLKFFGGEPLLEKRKIIQTIEELGTRCGTYMLTTNGTLLDDEFLSSALRHQMRITVSLDGDKEITEESRKTLSGKSMYDLSLKNIHTYTSVLRVNQVITPRNVCKMVESFKYLYHLGFREFNFLPEYYTEWSKSSLKELMYGFSQIQKLREQYPIHLINTENYSPTSFFNIGIVIDVDGAVYGTNLILSGRFEKYKKDLTIGSVFDTTMPKKESLYRADYLNKIQMYIEGEYGPNILRSVDYINRILSSFTRSYDQ